MSVGEFDYHYALNLTQRINRIVAEDKELEKHFIYKGYNYWQAYQTEIFMCAKRFSANRQQTISDLKKHSHISLFTSLLSFFSSLVSVIIGYVGGVKTIVYSVDKKPQGEYRSDFRLLELYTTLHEEKVSYAEVLHAPSGRSLWYNFKLRRRFAMYTSCGDILSWWSNTFSFKKQRSLLKENWSHAGYTEDEGAFVDALFTSLQFQFSLVPMRVRFLSFMLTLLRIERIYLIDDCWHYFELLVAGKESGVHTVAIQHGHFTKYHVGVLSFSSTILGEVIKPDRLFVWTEYWRNELGRLGSYFTKSEIVIAGVREMLPVRAVKMGERNTIGVLVPYETDAPKTLLQPYIAALLKCSRVTLYFKPRPDIRIEEQLRQYGFSAGDTRIRICNTLSECEDAIMVAFGTYTTLLYDMIGRGISVILATQVLDYGEGMVTNKLAVGINSPEELCEEVTTESIAKPGVAEARINALYGLSMCTLCETLRDDVCTFVKKND